MIAALGRLAPLALLALTAPLPSAASAETPWTIAATYPHDVKAFTEGLFYQEGLLYESTGLNGRSEIRAVAPETGKVLRRVTLDSNLFGEGIAPWKGRIISLTWRAGKGFVWRRHDFRKIGTFSYAGEGWGLTQDGHHLIMSDGTDVLRFLDPHSFKVVRRLKVSWEGKPVQQINELEYIDGQIFANIWYSPLIARIDPKSGHILDWINLAKLVRANANGDPDTVLNGIAWNAREKLLYVTGKNWAHLYALRLGKQAVPPGR